MRRLAGPLACMSLLVLAGPNLRAATPVEYGRDVKPILSGRCYACHGSLQQKSGLRLDTVMLMLAGGKQGPAIVPGKSADSLLIAHVTGAPGHARMPPASDSDPLEEKQIELLKAWIDQGAVGPPDERPEADPREHWAFHRPIRPAVPWTKDPARARNPIDAFLAVERDRRGLQPQPPADRRLLLRRLYLDLVGLPPGLDEQERFLADQTSDAYEKVVDRLLASPQYGERWARHWMDVWRYSDWWGLGAEVRNSQKHIWHWRDWIIESLVTDKGYDQMLREMLAADEICPNDLDRLRATGFLVRPYFIFNRTTWLDEVLEHTGKAFLGMTVNCAKCHDHKYDPVSQVDYYRLRAFFEPYQVRTDALPGQPDLEKDGVPRVFDCNLEAPTYRFVRGDDRRPLKDRPLAPGLPPLLSLGKLEIKPVPLPPQAHDPSLRPWVLEDQLRLAQQQLDAAHAAVETARQQVATATKRSPAGVEKPAPGKPAPPKALVHDDFAKPRPELWQAGPGKWKHEAGGLRQCEEGQSRSCQQLRLRPPADFEAKFRFVILGGEPWRSVGIAFDVANAQEALVYVSANSGGPKAQIAYKTAGNYVYPNEAALARAIPVGEPIELTVRVRGPLVNVIYNGEPALAYRLPVARQAGAIELITYAAKAELRLFELRPLQTDLALVEPAGGKSQPITLEQAQATLAVAEKALAAAQLQPESFRARAAAEQARAQSGASMTSRELARKAAAADAGLAAAKADEDFARAELAVLKATATERAAAEKQRTAARERLAQARKAAAAPGESFTPLRGALKAPESNLESMESRLKPYPTMSTGRRTALALWLTDSRHPLTARVAVNHLWARHFGRPLVATVFDFGRKGTPPTHPQLLDWLACELVESGWSLKHLHRVMVTSDAYRMTSSGASAPAAQSDPENRWYWRMNSQRMDAQAVRDSLLGLAGELDGHMGGPPIDPVAQEGSRRRSLYFVHSHNDHHKFLSMFDDASVLECYRRTESIVPQQALALSNSRFALEMANRLNEHLHARLGEVSDAVFVKTAFELVLASTPTAAEQAECERTLADLTGLLQKQGLPNARRRARGDLMRALVNHNDFITVR